jgi:uncharacterized membrane protein
MSGNTSSNMRDDKRAKFAKTAERRKVSVSTLITIGVIALAGAAIVWKLSSNVGALQTSAAGGNRINPAAVELTEADVHDDVVSLPLSTFDDGHAHYYTYQTENGFVEFFVLKSSDGVVRAAFNACDACFPSHKGYRQEGDDMVCNNCGQRFPSVRINEVRGGCNPAPLDRKIIGSNLAIHVNDILSGSGYFE